MTIQGVISKQNTTPERVTLSLSGVNIRPWGKRPLGHTRRDAGVDLCCKQ